MKCHCGNEAIEGFNLADICQPCFEAWERSGEPEECPCSRVVAFNDFASVHAAFCADVAGCTETAPCHPCAYWMARAYGEACPACAQTGLPLSSRVAAMPQ